MKTNGIISLETNNILKLKSVFIEPDGSIVTIGGKNGAGKTSVLDSIMFAFGGDRTLPANPIRKGQKKGTIKIKIDGYTITKTITKKGSYLKVVNSDGAEVASAQSFLNQLVGKVSFDPLAFSRMEPAEQGEELRKLVGIDTARLDSKRAGLYQCRTDTNREIKNLEGALKEAPCHEGIGTIEESVSSIAQKLREAEDNNTRKARLVETQTDWGRKAEAARNELEKLKEYIGECEDQESKAGEEAHALPTIDTTTIKARLENAEADNRKIRENQKHADLAGTHKARKLRSESLTEDIKKIDAEKNEMLRTAKYPIDGLGFDDDGTVICNGVPFAQASSAEKIRISVAIGIAMNPKLPVMRIEDGPLLDKDSIAMIKEMADKANAQIWMERVGEGDEVSVIIEDGSVKGADEEASDQDAA